MDFYYHFDGLGSTLALTDLNGTVTDTYVYDAWGNPSHTHIGGGSTSQPYLFAGQLGYYNHDQDDLLNPLSQNSNKYPLLQLGVRYYDLAVGRFTQRDPVPSPLHSYLYADDNPAVWTDPSGRAPWLPKLPTKKACSTYLMLARKAKAAGNIDAENYYNLAYTLCMATGSSPWEQCARGCLEWVAQRMYPDWLTTECNGHVFCFSTCDAMVGGRPAIYRYCLNYGIQLYCAWKGRLIPLP